MGQTLPRFWHSCKKGGRGKNYFIFAIFFAEPIFAEGVKPIIIFFAFFFADTVGGGEKSLMGGFGLSVGVAHQQN